MTETLGQRIRRLREQRQWSQQALGDVVGVSSKTVGNWENDRFHPRNRLGALEQIFATDLGAADADPVVSAVERSRLTEDRQYDVIGYYKRQLREQDEQREVRGA